MTKQQTSEDWIRSAHYWFFDIDGTLVDTVQKQVDATSNYLSQFKGKGNSAFNALLTSEQLMLRWVKDYVIPSSIPAVITQFEEQFALCFNEVPGAVQAYEAEFVKAAGSTKMYDGAVELINCLHHEGRRIALITSATSAEAAPSIALLEERLGHRFYHAAVTLDDVERPKPDLGVLHLVFNRLAVPVCNDYVMIGDSRSDILLAKHPGIEGGSIFLETLRTENEAAFPPGKSPDLVFPDIAGLYRWKVAL